MKSLLYGTKGKWIRLAGQFVLDMLFVYLSLRLAIDMRYDGHISASMFQNIMGHVPEILAAYALCSIAGRVYSIVWRYASGREILHLAIVYAVAALMTLAMSYLMRWHISRTIFGMTGITMLVLVVATRFLWKQIKEAYQNSGHASRARILIVGAGEGGSYAARICKQNRGTLGTPVAFVDDDPLKRSMRISGVPVCGTVNDVPRLVQEKSIDEIIVAVPGTHGERLTEIISICKGTRCRTRILSAPNDVGRDGKPTAALRELNTSDFLSREEVALDTAQIRGYLEGKVVLVTGGGGSIGSEICRQIMRFSPKQLLIFDIYENCAYELEVSLKQQYGADCPVQILIGSIRDRSRLDEIFETYHPTVVFHAAAHKHVPLMEFSPGEAVKNNVFGTRNLLESASSHGVERLVQLSTDKAVNPTNVMGATKRVTEMLIQSYARNTSMKCMAVRFGNVLNSHGSVIPLFESQIRNGGPVTLTDERVERYFMTIPEAAQLVLQAGGIANSGAIYVLDMGEPVKIIDLARKLIRFYGYEPGVDMEIKIIGMRPGEKMYEELMMDRESKGVTRTAHDKIFVAPPIELDEARFREQLTRLRAVADADDHKGIVDSLVEIVGTYTPNRDMIG